MKTTITPERREANRREARERIARMPEQQRREATARAEQLTRKQQP